MQQCSIPCARCMFRGIVLDSEGSPVHGRGSETLATRVTRGTGTPQTPEAWVDLNARFLSMIAGTWRRTITRKEHPPPPALSTRPSRSHSYLLYELRQLIFSFFPRSDAAATRLDFHRPKILLTNQNRISNPLWHPCRQRNSTAFRSTFVDGDPDSALSTQEQRKT